MGGLIVSKENNLSELQISILDILWEHGELSVNEVQELLKEKRDLAATTVATILKRLEKRNIVSYKKIGRRFIYSANIAKNEVTKSSVSSVVKNLFKGNKAALVSHLLQDEELSLDELEQIQKLIQDKTQNNG
ncbi:MAG TPA: BlaI/MecI/CopY family transcriptional regulator [Trueperaceae bacterium]|nr:BlaI/MecI/CopY family transcriptional regulator [Trueperaceae bacterium]